MSQIPPLAELEITLIQGNDKKDLDNKVNNNKVNDNKGDPHLRLPLVHLLEGAVVLVGEGVLQKPEYTAMWSLTTGVNNYELVTFL